MGVETSQVVSAQASQEMISASAIDAVETPAARPGTVFGENMRLFIQLLAAGVVLWTPLIAVMIWFSGFIADTGENFAEIRLAISDLRVEILESESRLTEKITELDSRLTRQINELDSRLTRQINELDSRLTGQIQAMDAKLNAIGDMTLLAYNDGEIDSSELAMIWEQARNRLPAVEPESE